MARRRQPVDEQEPCDLQSRLPQLFGPEVSLSISRSSSAADCFPFALSFQPPPFTCFLSIQGLKKTYEDMANLEPCLFA